MRLIGQVLEVWRYPISSVGGESVARAVVRPDGVAGDRQYGLIDSATGRAAAPENDARWRKALHITAASADGGHPILITFPDGRSRALDDKGLNEALSEHFGFAAAIAAHEHTQHRFDFPVTRYRHPHFPLHLLTTGSLERIASLCSRDAIDSRRFRPTVLVKVKKGSGFVENDWIGRRVRLGDLETKAEDGAKRCGVTFISQPGLAEDPEILRAIVRNNKRHLGIYCSIGATGTVGVGDGVFVGT